MDNNWFIGKHFIDRRDGTWTEGEEFVVNSVDVYGFYYDWDGRQWIVDWDDVNNVEWID